MAGPDDPKKSEWIDRIKSEGSIPLLDPDNCSNGWASPPGAAFKIRGPEYLTTKAKIPAGDYLLKPLGFDWIKSSVKMGVDTRFKWAIYGEKCLQDDDGGSNRWDTG